MGWKGKAVEKAKRKKKVEYRKALREAQRLKELRRSCQLKLKELPTEKFCEFECPPRSEAGRSWGPDEEDEWAGVDSDTHYMLATAGPSELSEEKMRQLHEDNFERFSYFEKYGMFEEEWDEKKQKYPDKYKGQYPPVLVKNIYPWDYIDVAKILAEITASGIIASGWADPKPVSHEESPTTSDCGNAGGWADPKPVSHEESPTTSDCGNAGGCPQNEVDVKPEYPKDSSTATSDSECRIHVTGRPGPTFPSITIDV